MNSNKINKMITFWKVNEKYGEFSQWYRSQFKYNDLTFSCCEQFMMYFKAMLFGDTEIAKRILFSNSPREIKEFGRQVKNFNESRWNEERFNIVLRGNYFKFSQNEKLKDLLLTTDDEELVEASPFDDIWGIGTTDLTDRRKWGQNLLGKILMEVRKILRTSQ